MTEERTIFQGSPSVLTRLGPISLGSLALVASLAGLIWLTGSSAALGWLFGAGAVAAAVYLLVEIVILKTTEYSITTERIRIRHGVLTKRTEEVELYRANDTRLIEPLLLRIFGLGTIQVKTMEEGNPTLLLGALADANTLRESLRTNIELCRDRKRVRMLEMDDDPDGHHH